VLSGPRLKRHSSVIVWGQLNAKERFPGRCLATAYTSRYLRWERYARIKATGSSSDPISQRYLERCWVRISVGTSTILSKRVRGFPQFKTNTGTLLQIRTWPPPCPLFTSHYVTVLLNSSCWQSHWLSYKYMNAWYKGHRIVKFIKCSRYSSRFKNPNVENILSILYYSECSRPNDRLCGLVIRILGYRSGGPGSIPGTTRFSEK
jgi:hypothetical protein